MSKGTRSIWMAALLALALGSGELVAYQGLAPHAEALLSRGGHRAALEAGRIVARNLSGIFAARAQDAAGELVLFGVKQTTRVYQMAGRVLGVADPAIESCAGADPECGTVVASEPDMPCYPDLGCETGAGARLACPACPACPERPAKVAKHRARGAVAKLGRSGA